MHCDGQTRDGRPDDGLRNPLALRAVDQHGILAAPGIVDNSEVA
jgi:hypothetical protein